MPFYLRDPFALLWIWDLRMQNHISEPSWKLRGEGVVCRHHSRRTAAPAAPGGCALGPQGLVRTILCDHLVKTAYISRTWLADVTTIFCFMLMNLGFKYRLQNKV